MLLDFLGKISDSHNAIGVIKGPSTQHKKLLDAAQQIIYTLPIESKSQKK